LSSSFARIRVPFYDQIRVIRVDPRPVFPNQIRVIRVNPRPVLSSRIRVNPRRVAG
jgi:hypothetical protein